MFSDSQWGIRSTTHCSKDRMSLHKQHGNENVWSNGHLGFPNKLNHETAHVIAESFIGIIRYFYF